MKIALVNQSTLVADADVARMAEGVGDQMVVVATEYDRDVPDVVVAGATDPCDVRVVILDDADQAGALGYHSEDPSGQAYARVFARDSIAGLRGVAPSSLSGNQPSTDVLAYVAQVVSHEALEAFVDQSANDWADDGNGTEWAFECADPVESSTYAETISDGSAVTLSNWVTRAFFDPSAPSTAEFDYLGRLSAPLSLDAGGYKIVRTAGTAQAVFGDELPAWRREQHEAAERDARAGASTARLASRTGRRFRQVQEVHMTDPSIQQSADGFPEPIEADADDRTPADEQTDVAAARQDQLSRQDQAGINPLVSAGGGDQVSVAAERQAADAVTAVPAGTTSEPIQASGGGDQATEAALAYGSASAVASVTHNNDTPMIASPVIQGHGGTGGGVGDASGADGPQRDVFFGVGAASAPILAASGGDQASVAVERQRPPDATPVGNLHSDETPDYPEPVPAALLQQDNVSETGVEITRSVAVVDGETRTDEVRHDTVPEGLRGHPSLNDGQPVPAEGQPETGMVSDGDQQT